MQIIHPEIGICGLSCRLCPTYYTKGESRCGGCKSEVRMAVGCPFITCAVKCKGIEFCWECEESSNCERWQSHREFSKHCDTFVCYHRLEDNISFIQSEGIEAFESEQERRQAVLVAMLADFNEGRSKRYYCIAATVMEVNELESALVKAREDSSIQDIKSRSKILHGVLDVIATDRGYVLALRKYREA